MTSKEALEEIKELKIVRLHETSLPEMMAPIDEFFKEQTSIIERDLNKLGQFEEIEKELGIDLITLFKASNKCFCKISNDIFEGFIEEIYITDLQVGFKSKENDLFELCFKGYGKTWALTKEELENGRF